MSILESLTIKSAQTEHKENLEVSMSFDENNFRSSKMSKADKIVGLDNTNTPVVIASMFYDQGPQVEYQQISSFFSSGLLSAERLAQVTTEAIL